jgi:hypothetical protein
VNRVTSRVQSEAIGVARDLMGPQIWNRVKHTAVFMGDPIAAGLHSWERLDLGEFGTGSYRQCAHVCYPAHIERPAADRRTTIVLPKLVEPDTVIHEFGHALHETLDFETTVLVEVTAYAAYSTHEAFAEAFTAWVYARHTTLRQPEWLWEDLSEWHASAEILKAGDPATWELFETLATK